jgi:hypothetical protein
MAKVFYDANGINVSDTVFVAPSGDQFPIRNITSVSVRESDNKMLLGIGGVLTAIGFFMSNIQNAFAQMPTPSYQAGVSMNGVVVLLTGIICLVAWHFTKQNTLYIGAGGTLQKAISYPKSQDEKLKILKDVSKAINESISNLQQT